MHVNAPVPKLPVLLADYQALLERLLAKAPTTGSRARAIFCLITP